MEGNPYVTGHIFAQINFGFQLIVLTEVGTMVVGGWKSYLYPMMEKELPFIFYQRFTKLSKFVG